MFEDSPPTSPNATPGLLLELWLVLAFCTRLPLPRPSAAIAPGALAQAMRLFPLAGLVVGGLGAAVYGLAHAVLPAGLAAVLAVAATVAATGALHEDGLADVADGFGGGVDKEAKLAIMRDSRIGSFALVTLTLTLLLRVGALASLASPGLVAGALVAAHALGRGAIPVAMQGLVPARPDGLGASAGQPTAGTAGIAATLALLIAAIALPHTAALAAVLAVAVASWSMRALARWQIGGQTGDVLGAIEQVAETAALLAVVAS